MKKFGQVLLVTVLLSTLFFAGSAPAASAKGLGSLEFNTMVGVPSALTGAQSNVPLRGISGGGLPWKIASGKGELTGGGHLEISVQGLVLAAGANAGSNPIASFRTMVSCVKSDGTFDNILTDAFVNIPFLVPRISGKFQASCATNW